MEAEEILAQARRSTELPHGWIIFPLLRGKVVLGILGWIFGILLGMSLFILIASIAIPTNFERGVLLAIITAIFLGVLLFIGLGSVYLLFADVRRLMEAEKHLLVLTPEDFVKQEGNKVVHVPLSSIRHVTARGVPPPDRTPSSEQTNLPSSGENITGLFFGRGLNASGMRRRRQRMRTPTSLAFVDTRTDREVIVTSDGAYGDTFVIANLLKQYATEVQNAVR